MSDFLKAAARSRGLILVAITALPLLVACMTTRVPIEAASPRMVSHSLSIGGVHFGKADIQSSNAIIDERELPVVTIVFTPTGQKKFQQAMHRIGVGRPMSIRVDRKEVTAPVLRDLDIKDRVTVAGLFFACGSNGDRGGHRLVVQTGRPMRILPIGPSFPRYLFPQPA